MALGLEMPCEPTAPGRSVGVRRLSIHLFQTSSPLKPFGQSKPNFMWSLLGKGGSKVCINGPGHMTKMAATTIYGKNTSKIFSRTDGTISMKLGM